MPQPDYIAVGQLPFLHRRVVDGGAVGGVEVGEQCHLAVPPNLQVAARHTGVRQPELRVLAAANDVGALAQLVGAPAAVVELQGDRGAGRRVAALPVAAVADVAAGFRGLAIVVVASGLGVAAGGGGVCLAGRVTVTPVIGLLTVSRPTGVALLVAAARLRVRPLVGCGVAALVMACRSPAVVAVLAVALAAGLAVTALAIARVVALGGAVTAGRPLFMLWRIAALVGVATALVGIAALVGVAAGLVRIAAFVGVAAALVGIAALVGVPAALVGIAALVGVAAALVGIAALVGRRRRITPLVGVAASFRWIGSAGIRSSVRVVLWMPVVLVVVVVTGPPLPLAAAVARILSHRYSWFCAKRMV